jgi:HSP20 family protein
MFYGKFKRIIKLPQNIAIDKIKNRYDNGVLSVRIPKKKPTHSNYKVLKIN